MKYLLDANACIHYLRNRSVSSVAVKIAAAPLGSVSICSIVVGELRVGARLSRDPSKNIAEVQLFCDDYVSLPFDDLAADHYSIVRAHLTKAGQLIGSNDMQIAAIALANGMTLVTHNTAEFCRVPGLTIEDWQ